ncbi:hypothetical protein J3Q64DRAFT_1241557 [Phycomyces blakesleeanus]|uniref:Uncharacterized protein n=1 Tax=Phycomyces blakesleeanus TaxID=4837 RepID=A0ABR3AQH0_PHYBL
MLICLFLLLYIYIYLLFTLTPSLSLYLDLFVMHISICSSIHFSIIQVWHSWITRLEKKGEKKKRTQDKCS